MLGFIDIKMDTLQDQLVHPMFLKITNVFITPLKVTPPELEL